MAVFEQYREEYTRLLKTAVLRPERAASARYAAALVMRGRLRYQEVGAALGIPWYFIGCIHLRESSCRFDTHLHNGDPLSERTVHVPAGRPTQGVPPFDWEYSASDALMYMGLDKVASQHGWSIERVLFEWECYNGFGYREPGRGNTPYLWADTNHYTQGKFTSDHGFDASHVDMQNGCAAVLNCLLEIDPYILTVPVPVPIPVPPAPIDTPPFIPSPPPSAGSAIGMNWSTIISIALGVLTAFGGGTGTGMWINSGGTQPPAPAQPPIVITQPLPTNGQCVLTLAEFEAMRAASAAKRVTPTAAAKKQVQDTGLFGMFKTQ